MDNNKRSRRIKKIWPIYVLGIIIFYWKFDFWKATIISIILSSLTLLELSYLRKNKKQNSN